VSSGEKPGEGGWPSLETPAHLGPKAPGTHWH
jgi:hypothetical protein